MNIIDKKPVETPENNFYGVNVNDKEAVQREFERLKKQHRTVTIVVIAILIVLGVIFFDFARVNFIGGNPLFAISKEVENGRLYSGIGYKVLYCENGERHIGSVLYKTCKEVDTQTFATVVYDKVIEYYDENKMLNRSNLDDFKINSLTLDEKHDEGIDYYLDVSYTCKDGSMDCLKTEKELFDSSNFGVYISLNHFNEIYNITYFKSTGEHTNQMVVDYTEKIKTYLLENEKMNEELLRSLDIKFVENHGKFKFRNVVYADSYLIDFTYMCTDNSNTCIEFFDKEDIDGDFANLHFLAAMFLDDEGNVMLMGPKQYLDL